MIYHDDNGYVMTAMFYTNPIFRLLDFLTGMAIALYFREHKTIHSEKLQLVSIGTFIVFLIIGAYGNISWLYKWGLFYLLPCGLLLFSFYGETDLSRKMFGNKIWLKLSSISMIIFLSHQLFLNSVKMYMPSNISVYFYEYFWPWGVLLCIFGITGLSWIINKYFAEPISGILLNSNNKDIK